MTNPLPPAPLPPQYTFPPFFTLQPNSSTYSHQLQLWTSWILGYCRHHKLYRLNLPDALETELFWNKKLGRRLKWNDVLRVVEEGVVKSGNGEWAETGDGGGWSGGGGGAGRGGGKTQVVVWWRTKEEWANLIYDWIESTGQKNTVLTLYEISEGDLTISQEFHGIDPYTLRKALDVLMRRGVAQVFSINDESGVKFF